MPSSKKSLEQGLTRRHQAMITVSRATKSEVILARRQSWLSAEEVESLRTAYSMGAIGEILVGMRQDRRLLTMYIPAQNSLLRAAAQMQRVAIRLKLLGCDGYIHVRRAQLMLRSITTARHAMIVAEARQEGLGRRSLQQRLTLLEARSKVLTLLGERRLEDEVSATLEAVFAAR